MNQDTDIDQIIEVCKKKVEQRKKTFLEIKAIYNPLNDREGSYTWSFIHNDKMEHRKASLEQIDAYEKKYKIKLPKLLVRVLTEIGSGGYINTHLISFKNELYPPYACMEKEFLDKCLDAKIAPDTIENGINNVYDFEKNEFTNTEIQNVYKSLGADRDKYLVILFDVGHDNVIVLNREDNMKVAVANVPGITNLSFECDGRPYDSPYYQYTGQTLEQVICPLNEAWWNKMKRDIIQMNL